MANIREIQSRINSVKDTMKITNAMYMISSSKMTHAKKKLMDTEPYFYALQGEISRILRHLPELEHHFFDAREKIPAEERKIGSIVVTADKGLAGAYNHNVVKLEEEILEKPGIHKLFVVGELGRHYFAKRGVEIDTNFQYTVQKPTMHRARDISGVLLEQFRAGELDEIYIVYTRMENSVQSDAEVLKLLPLERSSFNEMKMPLNMYREAIDLYPSAEVVMDSIIPNYVSPHDGDEIRHGQRPEPDPRPVHHLQQGKAGGDHTGDHRSVQRCKGTAEIVGIFMNVSKLFLKGVRPLLGGV